VEPDTALFRVYRELIALRRQHLRLMVDGSLNWLLTDDARGLLAYERVLGDQRAIVVFNVSDALLEVSLAAPDGRYLAGFPEGDVVTVTGGKLRDKLAARTARVWVRR
jgi:glycosidase